MKSFFVHFRVQILLALLLLLVLGLALLFPFYLSTPCLPREELPTTAIYDRQGQWLTYLPQADHYRQEPLPTDEPIPPMVQRALLASEDKRFLTHIGVDFLAIGRALYQNMTGSARRSGASTITMQLAKMSLSAPERGLKTKLHEALLARRLEMSYSKEELLRAYLNHADFGNLCRGIQTAARYYFNKDARDLNAPEAALLIAQLQSPTRYNPFRHPDRARAARDRILNLLGESIPSEQSLGLQRPVDNLPPHLKKTTGRLAIDPILQNYAYEVVQQEISALQTRNVQQAALIVIDNATGEVIASIASANPLDPRGGQMDGTRIRRSAGSTLKPFVYLLALRAGEQPSSIYADIPTSFPDSSGIEAPSNFNNLFLGPISMRTALACSQNIPALLALNNHGGESALLRLLAELGYEIEEDKYGLGLAIGNAHVSLREQAAAFSTLARGGYALPLRDHLDDSEPQPRALLDPRYVYQISDMLSDNDARIPSMGRADNLRFSFPCAVKTGTSSDFRDNWCVGYTPLYTVAVWAGNFDQSPMRDVSGLTGAGPIFQRVMSFLHENAPITPFARPDGLQEHSVDKRTGKLCDNPDNYLVTEWMTEEQVPDISNPADYDEEGRALLPIEYLDWLNPQGNVAKKMYAIDYDRDLNRAPRVLMPADGTVITLSGNVQEPLLLPLRSTINPHHARWFCRSMRLERRGDEWFALATKGEHIIYVEDSRSQRGSHCRILIR